MTTVPFILGSASLPFAPTPYFPVVFSISGFTVFVCRAHGGHEPPLLSYPAHSLITMSTELFQVTKIDTDIGASSLKSVVVKGFQKWTFPLCNYKFLRLTSQLYVGLNPELLAHFPPAP